jgi:hypothetical protein
MRSPLAAVLAPFEVKLPRKDHPPRERERTYLAIVPTALTAESRV